MNSISLIYILVNLVFFIRNEDDILKEEGPKDSAAMEKLFAINPEKIDASEIEIDHDDLECNNELVNSYRLFPFEISENSHSNYLCPYIGDDCCSFNS